MATADDDDVEGRLCCACHGSDPSDAAFL